MNVFVRLILFTFDFDGHNVGTILMNFNDKHLRKLKCEIDKSNNHLIIASVDNFIAVSYCFG